MNLMTEQNISLLQSMIEHYGEQSINDNVAQKSNSLGQKRLAVETTIKLINLQQDLIAKTQDQGNVIYHAYKVFKYLQNRNLPTTWKQLIQSRALRSGGVKLYRPAIEFLIDTEMISVEYHEKESDNVYRLTGRQFLTGKEELIQ